MKTGDQHGVRTSVNSQYDKGTHGAWTGPKIGRADIQNFKPCKNDGQHYPCSHQEYSGGNDWDGDFSQHLDHFRLKGSADHNPEKYLKRKGK